MFPFVQRGSFLYKAVDEIIDEINISDEEKILVIQYSRDAIKSSDDFFIYY